MKKFLFIFAIGAAAGCAIAKSRRQTADAKRPTIWDKLRAQMEEMPEDFPPRVMFDNAQAARENTEQILEILEQSGDTYEPGFLADASAS